MFLEEKPFYLNKEQIKWVKKTLKSMSIQEKIHQLFCLVMYNDEENECEYIGKVVQPGGVMCRVMPKEQVLNVVNRLQTYSKVPLLISANLEGGGDGALKEGTNVARPMQAAATGKEKYGEILGKVCGVEGKSVGINWSFAPIIDLDYNWHNPITNFRTFGSDPEIVETMGKAYVRAIQKEKVAACIKHFPGDGMDERDQHVSPSINSLSVKKWDETYGKVYKGCIEEGAMSVMVGHISQPAYTKKCTKGEIDPYLPASVNKALVTNLLRKKLKFNGVIITDSSAMAGLALAMTREEVVPRTIAAGCDMFLFTKNLEEDLKFMEKGYEKGIITEERLNEAVTRILGMKASLGLDKKENLCKTIEDTQVVGCKQHKQWEEDCAKESITLVKEEKGIFPITPKRFPRVIFYPLDAQENKVESTANKRLYEALQKEGFAVTLFEAKKTTEGNMTSVNEMKKQYDLIIYSAMVRQRYQPVARIRWSTPQGANIPVLCHTIPTVFISLENPYHLIDVPQVRTYINCYHGSNAVIKALMNKLKGHEPFTGKSPVDPFCGHEETKRTFGDKIDFMEYDTLQNIQGIIFDLDGVLLSTDEYHYLAWKALADELDIQFDRAFNQRFRGVGRMDCLEMLLEGTKYTFHKEEKENLANKKNNMYRAYLEQMREDTVSDEVRTTLQELRNRGYKLAVGSSSKNATFILQKTNLTSFFDEIVDGNDITHSKPHPEVFEKAGERLGLSKDACCVIEDAEAGLQAATSANMFPIGIADAKDSKLAKRSLGTFEELLKLFPKV